jgi:hypothetical protein
MPCRTVTVAARRLAPANRDTRSADYWFGVAGAVSAGVVSAGGMSAGVLGVPGVAFGSAGGISAVPPLESGAVAVASGVPVEDSPPTPVSLLRSLQAMSAAAKHRGTRIFMFIARSRK